MATPIDVVLQSPGMHKKKLNLISIVDAILLVVVVVVAAAVVVFEN